jgi:uncharacterized protein YggE
MLLLATVAYAQESRAPAEPANTVSVSAEGDFESAPDTAVIVCN